MERRELMPPLPEEAWPADIRPLAESLGKVLNIHRVIARSPALMTAYTPLRNYVVREGSLSERQRDLLILRTARTMGSEYEWQHHLVRGRAAGLGNEDVARVELANQFDMVEPGEGEDGGFPAVERALLRCADAMYAQAPIDVETVSFLQEQLGDAAVLDAIFVVGLYLTFGIILRTFDVPLEDEI
jgi:4-carboxymuconolactone decarboxylase